MEQWPNGPSHCLMSDTRKFEHNRIWSLLGWVWVVVLVAVLIALLFPMGNQSRMIAEGEACNENLDLIFRAKERFAESLNLDPTKPYPQIVVLLEHSHLEPYIDNLPSATACPSGGIYKIRPLVDSAGEVVAPVCTHETEDPNGDQIIHLGEGLHIHARSHLLATENGLYFREPAFSFAGEAAR